MSVVTLRQIGNMGSVFMLEAYGLDLLTAIDCSIRIISDIKM